MAERIETCIGLAASEGFVDDDERDDLLAELHELRRDAWHWREVRRLRMADSTRWFTITDFVAKGDTEWETKSQAVPDGA